MNRFAPGACYKTRSPCDYDCIIRVEILSRTASTVRAIVMDGPARTDGPKTFRVAALGGAETFRPWGRYSMSPIVSA